jgi:hypothetical protein
MDNTTIRLSNVSNKSANFTYKRGIVTIQFMNGTTFVAEPRRFSLNAAAKFGKRVFDTGQWKGFPLEGIDIATVRALGSRLREFAINGS